MGPDYPQLDPRRFDGAADGKRTQLFTLVNSRGMRVSFTNLGAKIQQIVVPDRQGHLDDVVLGYDSIEGVMAGQPSIGAFIGRFANRIANARFALDGRPYQLAPNSNGHSLHGGPRGSRYRVFDTVQRDAATAQLTLYYESGDDGFPGNLMSRVIYQVTEHDELLIRYDAVTDAPTVVNMTSHVFFNLAGHARTNAQSLAAHELSINASSFTPFGARQVPTGAIEPVAGTAMDFRVPHAVGERVDEAQRDFEPHTGYDHNWVIDKPAGELGLHARLHEPQSGRMLEVLSTEPGLVFFGGNNLEGESPRDVGKGGHVYEKRCALCLEPGHFPDSPNQPNFPSTVLRPGEWFSGTIIYRFGTELSLRA
jgi:aldose 1-epimerase